MNLSALISEAQAEAEAERGSKAVRARRSRYDRRQGWGQGTAAHPQPGHFQSPQTARLAKRAAAVDREDLSRFLGRGNFGAVYALDDDTVVKIAVSKDLHGRPWKREQIRDELLHEAGISNELAAAGLSISPWTVYVELPDGTPALVRERGVEVDHPTWADLAELESGIDAVERLGYQIRDHLLVLRRRNGSLFVGDVGIWKAPPQGDEPPAFGGSRSDADDELRRWAEIKGFRLPAGFLFLPQLRRLREATAEHQEEHREKPLPAFMRRILIEEPLHRIEAARKVRRQLGWDEPR